MTEPTERARILFFEALETLCATAPSMALNGKQMIALGKVIVPALAAAREEGDKIGFERCKSAFAKTGWDLDARIAAAREEGWRGAIEAKCDVITVGRHTLVQLAKGKEVRLTMSDGNQVILIHASDYPHELVTMEELY